MKYVNFAVLFCMAALQAEEKHGKGMKAPRPEEIALFHQAQAAAVVPNKIGAARMSQKSGEIIPAAEFIHEEFLMEQGSTNPYAASLPSSVDNSKLPSYPPIGDQGMLGSCVAWATTYYQATHEVGLAKGFNNKTGNVNILSPKWTYNLINFGEDGGAFISDGYSILSQNGAASISQFPYDGDYLAWDLNAQDWISALSFRTKPMVSIKGAQTSPQDLSHIKQALVNGHVLTFGTYIDSWVFTTIQPNAATQNLYVGEQACSWMNGTEGGHLITVVGYDDNVWIDINGNGKVDPGEMGAFLVSNSWSSGWGNDGFMWISYDAFLETSTVPNGPSQWRIGAADLGNGFFFSATPKSTNYKPSLVAQFGLAQTERNQIKIATGVSDTLHTSPSKYFLSGAVFYQGGPFEFNGSTGTMAESALFSVDMTDLVVPGSVPQRFYFMVVDNVAGNPTAIHSLSLVDLIHNNTLQLAQIPLQVDGSKTTQYIDYAFPAMTSAATEEKLGVKITSPTRRELAQGTVPVTVSVTGSVERVEFSIDSTPIGTDSSAPYIFWVDTKMLANGFHEFSVVAYDSGGNSAVNKTRVRVRN